MDQSAQAGAEQAPAQETDVDRKALRFVKIERMLKLLHPTGGGMHPSDVVVVLDFILQDMKDQMIRESLEVLRNGH